MGCEGATASGQDVRRSTASATKGALRAVMHASAKGARTMGGSCICVI